LEIKSIRDIGEKIYKNNPSIRPFVDVVRRKKPDVAHFEGWGMTTNHEHPWNDQYQGEIFRQASQEVKNEIEFVDKEEIGYENKKRIDLLLWRHWNISYAVRFSLEFAETTEYNFVECGVGEGITSFFILSELNAKREIKDRCELHLYDAWASMKEENLVEGEKNYAGRYSGLSIQRTKDNLSKFSIKINFNPGYLPESLYSNNSPEKICFLHIDLNSSKPTLGALEFFYSRLVKGGTIVFDDYAHSGYEETKIVVDEFFKDKSGLLQKLPTGQAIYYKH